MTFSPKVVDLDTSTLQRSAPEPPLAVLVRVSNASAIPQEYNLSSGSCRIGSSRDATIVVRDETVSRFHVELTLAREGVAVRDLGSHNGTFYLGQRVQSAVLSLGSRILIGRAEICFEPERLSVLPPVASNATHYGRLRGNALGMRQLYAVLTRLEGSLVSVLIEGESGTGKELAAEAIHEHSAVAKGPLIAINCGALDRALVRTELFGHRKGAFTGAVDSQLGAFELASGGTLFLDEIGELPLEVQPVLLRALESGKIKRVGETVEQSVNVRVIAATNRDLGAEVRAGRFREDLYYRLMTVRIQIPPLRERGDDIPLLIQHFATELGLHDISAEAMARFRSASWRGNVRELRNALRAYAAVGTLPGATSADGNLDELLLRMIDVTKPYAPQKEQLVSRFSQLFVKTLLAHTNGNQSEASRISGLERSHLNKLVTRFTLPPR